MISKTIIEKDPALSLAVSHSTIETSSDFIILRMDKFVKIYGSILVVILTAAVVKCGIHTEYLKGVITPADNKTYEMYLDGMTQRNYSTVTLQYSTRTRLLVGYSSNPVLYFRHVGQEHGYGTDNHCYGVDFRLAINLDPRIFALYPSTKQDGSDKICTIDDNYLNCSGSLKLAIGFQRQFYISIGFLCGFESPLDIDYNFTVTGYDDGDVSCSDWSTALDELSPPIPAGLQNWVNHCQSLYGQFSKWNGLGFNQHDFKVMYPYFVSPLSCYQHFKEIVCYLIFPDCTANTVFLSCADMCRDLNKGCTEQKVFYNVSCTSLKNASDPGGKKCFYDECTCETDPLLPPHGRFISMGGGIAPEVTTMDCESLYKMSVPHLNATCGYDGAWHYSNRQTVTCDLIVPYVVGIVVTGCCCIFIVILVVMFRYRFKLKLLAFKYCSCCLCFCRCFRRLRDDKIYDTFICYPTAHRHYVDDNIFQPLKNANYNAVIDYEHPKLNFGANLIHDFAEAIDQSSSLIAVINQDFINSDWCMFEFDHALTCTLDDPSFVIVLILTEPLDQLNDAPSWFMKYLTNHLYIESGDEQFLLKLKHGLPIPTGYVPIPAPDMGDSEDDSMTLTPEQAAVNVEYDRINVELRENARINGNANEETPLLLK